MIYYRAEALRFYKPGNRHFYAYEGIVMEYSQAEELPKVLFRTVCTRRSEALKLATKFKEAKQKALKLQQSRHQSRAAKIQLIPWGARPEPLPVVKGMAGRNHSPEARRAISEAMKRRWAEGAYKDAKLGGDARANAQAKADRVKAHNVAMADELDRRRHKAREKI